MPRWDVSDRHEVNVAAPAERAYRAVRTVDLAAAPVARLLYAIRFVPSIGRRHRPSRSVTLDDMVRTGFVLLAERPGVEIVLGVAGRFWTPAGAKDALTAGEFIRHARPGTAKAAMSFRVDALGIERSRVVTETRVLCADAVASRSFRRYWRVVRPGSAIIRRLALAQIKREAESPTRRI